MASFWQGYAGVTLITIGEALAVIVPVLIAVAYLTYFERKVLAFSQLRKGPNVVGPFGLLQPFADGLKLLLKETVVPSGANRLVFIAAPVVTFTLALVAWAVIPFDAGVVVANINVGILYLFAISSLGVYGIILAGWASNSRYAFLGALRSAAQMVSYEVAIGFVLVTVLLCAGSLNLGRIVEAQRHVWFVVPLLPMAVIFFISGLRNQSRPVRHRRRRERIGGGLFCRIFRHGVRPLLSRRIRQHDPDQRDDQRPVSRRLAGAVRRAALHLGAGMDLVFRQDRVLPVRVFVGARDLSAVPL